MKAIINIKNKNNQFSKLNGLSFEVGEVLKSGVGLVGVNPYWPKNQTDFNFDEILIENIQDEFKSITQQFNNGACDSRTAYIYSSLQRYIAIKNIKL